ncbi:putative transmembrane protein 244 [Mobula birostris]|uniref:putative transmembrane protein 244 n=1 Tax=Mobula birostris TaxID=1983395 RepID=UPI003B28B307
MAMKFKATDTKTVLLQLLLCLTIFYAVYYVIGIIFFGAFRLETYDEFMPFDFKTEPSYSSSEYKVNLISMELTYFVCGLLFAGVVKEWIWDYAITVTLIHVAVTSTTNTPKNVLGKAHKRCHTLQCQHGMPTMFGRTIQVATAEQNKTTAKASTFLTQTRLQPQDRLPLSLQSLTLDS